MDDLDFDGLSRRPNNPNFAPVLPPPPPQQPQASSSSPSIRPTDDDDRKSPRRKKRPRSAEVETGLMYRIGASHNDGNVSRVSKITAPPTNDAADDEEEDPAYRAYLEKLQRSEEPRRRRWTGMTLPVYDNLQYNLEMVLSDGLRQSIQQALHPYAEFVTLILAASGGELTQEDVVYKMIDFDQTLEFDKDGKPIRDKDAAIDMRGQRNFYEDVANDTLFSAPDMMDPELSFPLTQYLKSAEEVPGFIVRLASSFINAAPEVIAKPFDNLFKNVRTKWENIRNSVVRKWDDMYTRLRLYITNTSIYNKLDNILRQTKRLGSGASFMALNYMKTVLPTLTNDVITFLNDTMRQTLGLNAPIQSQMFIGQSLGTQGLSQSKSAATMSPEELELRAALMDFTLHHFNLLALEHIGIEVGDPVPGDPAILHVEPSDTRLKHAMMNYLHPHLPEHVREIPFMQEWMTMNSSMLIGAGESAFGPSRKAPSSSTSATTVSTKSAIVSLNANLLRTPTSMILMAFANAFKNSEMLKKIKVYSNLPDKKAVPTKNDTFLLRNTYFAAEFLPMVAEEEFNLVSSYLYGPANTLDYILGITDLKTKRENIMIKLNEVDVKLMDKSEKDKQDEMNLSNNTKLLKKTNDPNSGKAIEYKVEIARLILARERTTVAMNELYIERSDYLKQLDEIKKLIEEQEVTEKNLKQTIRHQIYNIMSSRTEYGNKITSILLGKEIRITDHPILQENQLVEQTTIKEFVEDNWILTNTTKTNHDKKKGTAETTLKKINPRELFLKDERYRTTEYRDIVLPKLKHELNEARERQKVNIENVFTYLFEREFYREKELPSSAVVNQKRLQEYVAKRKNEDSKFKAETELFDEFYDNLGAAIFFSNFMWARNHFTQKVPIKVVDTTVDEEMLGIWPDKQVDEMWKMQAEVLLPANTGGKALLDGNLEKLVDYMRMLEKNRRWGIILKAKDPQLNGLPNLNNLTPEEEKTYKAEIAIALSEAYVNAIELISYFDLLIAIQWAEENILTSAPIDRVMEEWRANGHIRDVYERLAEQEAEGERVAKRQREVNEIARQKHMMDRLRLVKSTRYDPDADVRYKFFEFFGRKITTMAELSRNAIIFKNSFVGAIKIAADDLNLNLNKIRPNHRPFDIDLLIFSPMINSRFANLVVYIYRGRTTYNAMSNSKRLTDALQASTGNTTIIRTTQSRFNISEDHKFMQGVLAFFADVHYDAQRMMLIYRPSTQPTSLTRPALLPGGHLATHSQQPPQQIHTTLLTPVFRPFRETVANKRQRVDFMY